MPRFQVLLALACAALLLQQASAFIRVFNTSFADENCREFAWVGANTWRMLEAQSGLVGVEINGMNPVTNLLDQAAALNITVLRAFASGTRPELPLQTAPGVYNEVALKALDQMLADAASRGLRILLILARNWGGPDSRIQYASWNGLQSPDDFYASPAARQDYKDNVAFLVSHVNTVNGRVYRDDPTIFGWDLMNEPRFFFNGTSDPCAQDPKKCADTLQSWIEEMSTYLKSQDPNHLVTVGEEGFFGSDSPQADSNPQPSSNWAEATAQDFVANHQIPTIDFAGIHIWPDNWGVDTQFIQAWIQAHMDATRGMGKPLIIEEFGKNVSSQDPATIAKERNPTFETVLAALNSSLESGDVLKAAQYWMWDPALVDSSSPEWANISQDQVFPSTSTMTDIIAPTARGALQYNTPVAGCTPQATSAPAGRKLLRVPLPPY